MKALSVKQPWASLIAGGHKPLEIRSRRTHYRGPVLVLVCSSLKPDSITGYCPSWDYWKRLIRIFPENVKSKWHLDEHSYSPSCTQQALKELPLGQALCVVNLTDCRPMTKEDEFAAWVPYQKELWAWVFQNIQPLKPFPVKGRLGLWNYNGDSKTCKHYFGPDRCDIEPSCDWYPANSLFVGSK